MVLVNASKAWEVTVGSRDVIVAIIDSGIDFNHPEFNGAIWTNEDEIADNAVDDDGNGYIDDIHGWDFYNNDPVPADDHGHGTFVAGIISALNDGIGTAGLAPNVTLMPLKYLNQNIEGGTWTDFGNAVDYAVANGADIISMSVQTAKGYTPPSSFASKITAAAAAGVLLVSVTGNYNYGAVMYPGKYPEVIAVTAVDKYLARGDFADYGPETELAAPGVAVESTTFKNWGDNSTLMINGYLMPSFPIEFSPLTGNNGIESTLVYVDLGRYEDYAGIDVMGKIALISRGEITFKEKVTRAGDHGAIAAIIYNNVQGDYNDWTLTDPTTIPAVAISQEDGNGLVADLEDNQSIAAQLWVISSNYTFNSGTSFATPHVAAAAALMLSANPDLKRKPEIVRELLARTARDLGTPGRDDIFGWGLLDAGLAVHAAIDTEPPALEYSIVENDGNKKLNYQLLDSFGVYTAKFFYRQNSSDEWKTHGLISGPVLNDSLKLLSLDLDALINGNSFEYYFELEDWSFNAATYPENGLIHPYAYISGNITDTTVEISSSVAGYQIIWDIFPLFIVLIIRTRKRRKRFR
ncbi:MAG: S8 family serine peptidase [Candidatus Hodarchaeales archaeon]